MLQKSIFAPSKFKRRFDVWLLGAVVFFCLFGLLMIYEASNVVAFREFGDKYKFVKDQFIWTLLGFTGLGFTFFIPYKKYIRFSFLFLAVSFILLIAVLIPGIGIKVSGAHRWIEIGNYNFQPSEFTKLAVVLYLSSWLSEKKVKFSHFLLLLAATVGLIILQPDLGTAIVLTCIFIFLYFVSGTRLWHIVFLTPVLLGSVIVLALISPYRMQRISTFLNPAIDPLGASYHIRQILISYGAGGIWGLGLGASRQKYLFLPAATTDSIFAIISEEFGFVGSSILILAYCFVLYHIFLIAKNAPDHMSYLLSCGILMLLGVQILINLGAAVVLFPLTGVPLPFISYGGSNLIMTLIALGILLQIGRKSG